MNYTLNQLRIFTQVVKSGSISKAAEALDLSQPAVSIQLKNLQQHFDVPLTETIRKRLHITPFGRDIAQAAENLIQEAQGISQKTKAQQGKLSGRLRISAVSTGKYVIPYFLSSFLAKHQDIELNLDVSNNQGVLGHLRENEIDFALVSTAPKNAVLHSEDLMRNELYLAISSEMHIPRSRNQHDLLRKLTLIFREDGSATNRAMNQFLESNDIKVFRKIQLTSNEAVKQAVIAGLGVSILPMIGIRHEIADGRLKIIPMKGLPLKTTWRLVWHREKKHTPVATAFLEHVRNHKAEVLEKWFG
ncbi:MAG: LysR family transcriptional regulator [Flavobacteriales bacterium]